MEALGEVDEAVAADTEYQSEHERRVELPAPSGDADAMAVGVFVSAAPSTRVELEAPTRMQGAETVAAAVVPTMAQTTASGTAPTAPRATMLELPATPVDPPTITIAGPSPEARAPAERPADPFPRPSKIRRPQMNPAASYPPSPPRRSASTTAVPVAPSAPADWAAAREQWSVRARAAAAAPEGAPAVLTAREQKREQKKRDKKLRPSRSSSLRARLALRASRSQPELRIAAPNWVIDEAYDEDEPGAEAPRETYPRSLEAPIVAVPPLPVGAWARSWAAAASATTAAAAVVPARGETVVVAAA